MLCPVRALFSIKEYVQLLVNYANCESARPIGSCSKLRLNKKTGPARDTQNNPRKHTPTRSRYRPGAARVLPCVSSRLKRLFGKFSPALALMETRQQELYSGVLSEAVVDWGSMGPGEEWVNSAKHQGEQERGHLTAGFLDSEPLRETDEDMASEVHLNSLTEEEREEIQQELAKLEEEISTLKQVLTSKEKQHAELKQKLGMSSLNELRNNLSRGWHDVQTTTAYKKTSETLSTAGQKTSAAFNTLGSAITRKFGDMRSNSIGYAIRHSMSMPTMRNSPSFKSFEEKVETTVSTIKTKVGGTETGGSFEEVLSSAAHASSQDTPTNNLTDSSSERPC
ncbi:tumor protein D53 isoform X3 [Anarrhichthys ocellatus]|uniref:tumor protein D53 isoform X3 n=1 Tax=Anarrhichthys ocellatus TaxID=433405 RepID=UPI0012ECD6FA|nr:tumor protein D53 isoform X3 [Anarrhichthys ocellatus]